MTEHYQTDLQKDCGPAIVGRNDFLFTAGAVAIIAGFFVPLSTHVVDVLIIFTTTLTVGILIIAFLARTSLEISGLPLLIILTTELGLGISIACSKLILSKGQCGTIIGLFDHVFIQNNIIPAIIVFIALSVIIFGTIFKAVKAIGRTASKFITDVVPIKRISIDSDLNAGIINKQQALDLQGKTAREARFFVTMTGAARFILCAAVVELVIVMVNIVASMAFGVMSYADTGITVQTYGSLAIVAGVITQMWALITVLAARYLVRKSSTPAATGDELEEQTVKEVEVVTGEVVSRRVEELKHDDRVYVETPKAAFEECEWLDEPGPANAKDHVWECPLEFAENDKKEDKPTLWSLDNFEEDYCYEAIAELIEGKSANEVRIILMAAESLEELPVTVPVNITMQLAQKEHKCLLIDLDPERGAISKAFDVDSTNTCENLRAKGIETCIANLHVWGVSGSEIGENNEINVKEIIAELDNEYDHIIIYAPNIRLLVNHNAIASSVQSAMLFGPDSKIISASILDFSKILGGYGCGILKPEEVFAEVA